MHRPDVGILSGRRIGTVGRPRQDRGRAGAGWDESRWNDQSLSSGSLANEYGFTGLDGSRPDAWRYIVEVERAGKPADTTGYR